ncbi:MAG: SDR family NAD(P)-dependent oxidoreductase, partial [Muribaculaceae bacterium]|nr:SDR family NAD(P)-dependent oxidoreductase [Muribaculaceae bacterium]
MEQTVLVTGATSGIGRACAETFLGAGYRVIVTGRRLSRLHDIFEKYGERCHILAFD